jgi:hypothetical protein
MSNTQERWCNSNASGTIQASTPCEADSNPTAKTILHPTSLSEHGHPVPAEHGHPRSDPKLQPHFWKMLLMATSGLSVDSWSLQQSSLDNATNGDLNEVHVVNHDLADNLLIRGFG